MADTVHNKNHTTQNGPFNLKMKDSLDLQIQDKCQNCDLRGEAFFCELSGENLRNFEAIKVTKFYSKGTLLFVEGQAATGIHLLCQGRVKLSTCSSDGKIIILGIAAAGDVLGLSAVVSGIEYEATAESLESCQVNFVSGSEFLKFLQDHPEASMNAATQLSRDYNAAHKMICSLAHSDSVLVKLAKLFLGWSTNGQTNNGTIHLKNSFTHEDIAEMIGTARETVTRTLKEMREREIVTLKGTDLFIHDHDRLRFAAGLRYDTQTSGNGHCDHAHRHDAR